VAVKGKSYSMSLQEVEVSREGRPGGKSRVKKRVEKRERGTERWKKGKKKDYENSKKGGFAPAVQEHFRKRRRGRGNKKKQNCAEEKKNLRANVGGGERNTQ